MYFVWLCRCRIRNMPHRSVHGNVLQYNNWLGSVLFASVLSIQPSMDDLRERLEHAVL